MLKSSAVRGREVDSQGMRKPYASASDYAECRRLHRSYGKTYFFASRLLDPGTRAGVDALYGFVRVPDEWVDQTPMGDRHQVEQQIDDWRTSLKQGLEGIAPQHPAMRAFCDLMLDKGVPLEEPLQFLAAMKSDLTTRRYETFKDLRGYMRGSAAAVGTMMCYALDASIDEHLIGCAKSLGEAMQLTNFIRDVGEDVGRGRIYLPLEDLASFGVREEDVLERKLTSGFKNLLKFEIDRARALYKDSEPGIERLPPQSRRAVWLARRLYGQILEKVELQGYDIFSKRAKTSRLDKLRAALSLVLVGSLSA